MVLARVRFAASSPICPKHRHCLVVGVGMVIRTGFVREQWEKLNVPLEESDETIK